MERKDLKILVVEDDASTRSTIRTMLNGMGINQIFEETDGNTARAFLDDDANSIDLVISDWNMPQKTGIDLLRDIRAAHTDLPFIMITARADADSVREALHAGVTAYIRKPFSLKELENKINAVLAKTDV